MPGLIRRAPGAPHRATFGSGAISQSRGSCPLPVGGRINSQKATCVASTIRAKHATSCPALCKFRPCLFHSSLRSLNDQVIERFGDRVLLKPCLGSAVRGFMYSVQCAILQRFRARTRLVLHRRTLEKTPPPQNARALDHFSADHYAERSLPSQASTIRGSGRPHR